MGWLGVCGRKGEAVPWRLGCIHGDWRAEGSWAGLPALLHLGHWPGGGGRGGLG